MSGYDVTDELGFTQTFASKQVEDEYRKTHTFVHHPGKPKSSEISGCSRDISISVNVSLLEIIPKKTEHIKS